MSVNKGSNKVQIVGYGDVIAQLFLWEKALFLVPLWAIPIVPLIGFFSRTMGPMFTQIGYALVLVFCANYFFEDLLKRKIRMDDEYIYFGYRTVAIKDIIGIEVLYRKNKLLPGKLVLTCASGKSLKLSLNGLSERSIEVLLKHLQSRNSNLKTTAILATLIKCRRLTQKPVVETTDRLAVPYNGRQLLEESLDAFRATAMHWVRLGPLVVSLLVTPVWLNWVSSLYMCLQPHSMSAVSSINCHLLFSSVTNGIGYWVNRMVLDSGESVQQFAGDPLIALFTTAFIAVCLFYVYRTFCRPNTLVADNSGINLQLNLGDFSFPQGTVPWTDVTEATLEKPKGYAGTQHWKIRLANSGGKVFRLDMSALAPEDRARLLKRIESCAPQCRIDPELSQSMLPKSERSYTELWLQSLTQSPERKTMDPLEPGQLLGEQRFQVVKRLGVGGQGMAYLCRSMTEDGAPNVVLKETILPVFVESSIRRKALENFEQEARMLQALNSDRIVKLLDYFIEDHRSYLVLEHIDGLSLRETVLRSGPLDSEQVHSLALQMIEILKELHSHSVIHRDFTPDNLILNSSGTLKLIDFNVAQQLKEGSSGTIVGKHAYLPPEQFRGKATTQSDLYAMGATLFYLLTGCDPEPISQSVPSSADPSIDAVLNDVVKRATALQCDKRYQNADQIERDLLGLPESTSQGLSTIATQPNAASEQTEDSGAIIQCSTKEKLQVEVQTNG